MEMLFMICLGLAAGMISLQKIAGGLHVGGASEMVAHYLTVLEQACLVAALGILDREA